MNPNPIICERCGDKLNPAKAVWLEKSFKTNLWYAAGGCPEKESQGCFPFGADCARALLKEKVS